MITTAYEPIVDRIVQTKPDGTVVRFIRGFINSDDPKPVTGIYDRSELYERDTGKWYLFNMSMGEWFPQGGGSGASELPDASQATEGDVLTVHNGEWVAGVFQGGDGVLTMEAQPIPFIIAGGGYIAYASPGGIGRSSILVYTDYVDVSNYRRIYYKRGSVTGESISSGIVFYDENKEYVLGLPSAASQPTNGYLTDLCVKDVPKNAKYARFTAYKDTATYGEFELYGEPEIVGAINATANDVKSYVTDKFTWVYPENWLDKTALTSGIMRASGSITSDSTKVYTDYIPVEPGDTIRICRTDNHGNGYFRNVTCFDEHKNIMASSGNNSSSDTPFTVPDGVYYVRITGEKSTLQNNAYSEIVKNVDDVSTLSFSEYFAPYPVLIEDFLKPDSKEVLQQLVDNDMPAAQLKNNFACALPKVKLRMTVGIPERWYKCNAFNVPGTFGSIEAGQAYTSQNDVSVYFKNTDAVSSTNGYSWSYYDPFLSEIDSYKGNSGSGGARTIITENLSDCTLLAFGASTIGHGKVTQGMLDHFTEQGHVLTLRGTRGTAPNLTEGRPGWSTSNYYTNKTYDGVVNPFYNPTTQTFDFSYYMSNRDFPAPDFMLISLGINDIYNGADSDIIPTYNRLKGIIDSVFTYNTAIKIIFLPLQLPTEDQTQMSAYRLFVASRLLRSNAYTIEHLTAEYSQSLLRVSYGHLLLNPATDYEDNIHPTTNGGQKIALEICNQINCWQNSV